MSPLFLFVFVFIRQQPSGRMVSVQTASLLLSFAPLLVLSVPPIWTQPEQVHLSYAGRFLSLPYKSYLHMGTSYSVYWQESSSMFGHVLCEAVKNKDLTWYVFVAL